MSDQGGIALEYCGLFFMGLSLLILSIGIVSGLFIVHKSLFDILSGLWTFGVMFVMGLVFFMAGIGSQAAYARGE